MRKAITCYPLKRGTCHRNTSNLSMAGGRVLLRRLRLHVLCDPYLLRNMDLLRETRERTSTMNRSTLKNPGETHFKSVQKVLSHAAQRNSKDKFGKKGQICARGVREQVALPMEHFGPRPNHQKPLKIRPLTFGFLGGCSRPGRFSPPLLAGD